MGNFLSGLSGAASGAAAGSTLLPGIGTVAGGVAGLLGGLFGGGGDDEEKAMQLRQQAVDILASLPDLDPRTMQVALERLRQEGILTPELENAVQQEASEMSKIKTDPRLKDAQMNALKALQERGEAGFTPEERAQLDAVNREQARRDQAARQSILQQRQMRGIGGAGDELAAQLQAQQASAEQAQQSGQNLSAQANARALQAIMQSGQLGGQIQAQDFEQQSAQARAQDLINQFNASQRAGVGMRNVAAKNQAQASNLAERQRIADANAGLQHKEQFTAADSNRAAWDANFRKRAAQSNALSGQAGAYQDSANRSNQGLSQFLQGLPSAASGIKDAFGNREKKPTQEDMNKPEYGWGGGY